MPNDTPITTAVQALAEAADALVDEARGARDARVQFAVENRDAHAASATRVGELAGRVSELAAGITASRIENASALAAAKAMAEASAAATKVAQRMLVAVTGMGSGVLIFLVVALLYAVLTMQGVDADAALGAGGKAAHQLVPGSSVTTATSSTITTTPAAPAPEGDPP